MSLDTIMNVAINDTYTAICNACLYTTKVKTKLGNNNTEIIGNNKISY